MVNKDNDFMIGEFEVFNVGERIVCINNQNFPELIEGETYTILEVDGVNVVIYTSKNTKQSAWSARFVLENEYEKDKLEHLKEERRKKLEKLEQNPQ